MERIGWITWICMPSPMLNTYFSSNVLFFMFSLKYLGQNDTFVINKKVKRGVERKWFGFGSPLIWVRNKVKLEKRRQKGTPLEMIVFLLEF